MTEVSPAALSHLIGRIYDCALDAAHWPTTLAAIKDALGFAHATLSLQAMPTGRVLFNVTSGVPSPWLEAIGNYGSDIVALWGGPQAIADAPLEEPLRLSAINPEVADGSSRNRYYLEWRRPQGLTDTVTIGLARDTRSLSTASFVRHVDAGSVGTRELDVIRLLAPHLRRAVTVGRLLDAGTAAGAMYGGVVDACAVPIVIVDADRQVLHVNRAAGGLDATCPLLWRTGTARVDEPTADRALATAVAQAAVDESKLGRVGLAVPVRGASGTVYMLHVLPLANRASRPRDAGGAAAAIFVASAEVQPGPVGQALAALYAFTPAEARVFDLIARGNSAREVAAMLEIGTSTVRTHLARLFDKTGLSRQIDLVRMAAALSAPAI